MNDVIILVNICDYIIFKYVYYYSAGSASAPQNLS